MMLYKHKQLITEVMVAQRVNAGEDPLDVSLDVWKCNYLFLLNGGNPCDLHIGKHMCGLCMAYYDNNCSTCPLKAIGQECDSKLEHDAYSIIRKTLFYDSVSLKDKLFAIKNMLHALSTAKKYQNKQKDHTKSICENQAVWIS